MTDAYGATATVPPRTGRDLEICYISGQIQFGFHRVHLTEKIEIKKFTANPAFSHDSDPEKELATVGNLPSATPIYDP